MTRYAHSHPDKAPEEWQLLATHLVGTSKKAGQFASPFAGSEWAIAAAALHDLGKASDAFQTRLHGGPTVDHKSSGAAMAQEAFGIAGSILTPIILGHHGGMPDTVPPTLTKHLTDEQRLLAESLQIKPPQRLPPTLANRNTQAAYSMPFFIRMLYSCLVDADFLDTEAFIDESRSNQRGNYPDISILESALSRHLNKLTSAADSTPVNAKRAEVLTACLECANHTPGLFSLTVPTGGGKTLSSLSFALAHARANGLERVIYVIPYTSIIEQNADVFRSALGEDAVVEHHSNFAPEQENDTVHKALLASENWDAPLIVTTNVQFFESLHAAKPSRCRKLHNIAKSVIILDEAQMLPPDFIRPCVAALRELVEGYGSSVVLCTATQPALSLQDGFPEGLADVHEIIPNPTELHASLRRVRVETAGTISDEELAESLLEREQVLCVVNTRRHARELFERIAHAEGVRHLSALMCPAHRSQVLTAIRSELKSKKPCRLVSTQLVEAGVDVSFPTVFRAMAGLDSIAQAAGRCNREGELPELGHVYVFTPADKNERHVRQQIQSARRPLEIHREDLLSPTAQRHYFQELFWSKGAEALDRKDILGKTTKGVDRSTGKLNIPFRTIASDFRLIDSGDMRPIIIPWGTKGQELVDALNEPLLRRGIHRQLQRYTVQVRANEFEALRRAGAISAPLHDRFTVLLNQDIYHEQFGLDTHEPDRVESESLNV